VCRLNLHEIAIPKKCERWSEASPGDGFLACNIGHCRVDVEDAVPAPAKESNCILQDRGPQTLPLHIGLGSQGSKHARISFDRIVPADGGSPNMGNNAIARHKATKESTAGHHLDQGFENTNDPEEPM